jgi:uncharacterized protein
VFFGKLGPWLTQHRWWALGAFAVVTVVSVCIAPFIEFNFTPQAILRGDAELHAISEEIKDTFGHEHNIVVVALRATGEDDVLTVRALEWQRRATLGLNPEGSGDEPAQVLARSVQVVDSLATVGIPRDKVDVPGTLEITPLINKSRPVDERLPEHARRALREAPLVTGQLISRDFRLVAVGVRLHPEVEEIEDVTAAVGAVRAWTEANPPPEGYDLVFSGVPVLRVKVVEDLRSEQLTQLPLVGAVFLIVLVVLFRRPSGVFLPLVAAGVSIVWTVAAMVLLDQHVHVINTMLPTLLFVIGMSDCVHIVTRYAEEHHATPTDPAGALKRTISHMGLACLLTSGTTAIGFLSLVVARSELLQSFGWQAAMGCMFLYVSVIVVLGSTMPLLKPAHRGALESASPGFIEKVVDSFARVVTTWPKLTLALGLGIMGGCIVVGVGVHIDSYLMETYEEDHVQARSMRIVERELGGFLPVEIEVTAPTAGAFREPGYYRRIHALQSFAAQQDGVLLARSYVDFHQELRANLMGDPAQRKVLPTDDDKGRRQIFQIQEVIGNGPSLGFDAFMAGRFDRARILVRVEDVGSRRMIALVESLRAESDEIFAGTGSTVRFGGEAYAASSGIDVFIRDLAYSLLAAIFVIFLLMGLLFKSLRLGLISVLPNVGPLVVTMGYIGIRGYDLNVTNVVIFAVGLGLAVNDTIHFLTRFREELAVEHDVQRAILTAFRGAGRAIVLTTVLLVLGLGVLLTSEFVPSQRFAELVTVTLAGALIGDLLVLPALLMLFWKNDQPRGTRGST